MVGLTGRADAPRFEDKPFEELKAEVLAYVKRCYDERVESLGEELMAKLNRQVMLRVIDTRWMTYLQEMDYLKQGIGLRGFGQRDPLVEYKGEAFAAFRTLVDTMYEDYLRTVLRIEVRRAPAAAERQPEGPALERATYSGPTEVDGAQAAATSTLRQQAAAQAAGAAGGAAPQPAAGPVRPYVKAESGDPYANVGRNDPCPCGSGKKFKNCHGRNR